VSEDQEAAQRRKLKTSTLHGQLQRFVPLVREVIDPGIKNQKEKIKAFQKIATKVAHLLTAEVGKLRDTMHETVSELDDAVKMNKEFATHLMEQLRAEEDGTGTKLPIAVYDTGGSAYEMLVQAKKDLKKLLYETIPSLEGRCSTVAVR